MRWSEKMQYRNEEKFIFLRNVRRIGGMHKSTGGRQMFFRTDSPLAFFAELSYNEAV